MVRFVSSTSVVLENYLENLNGAQLLAVTNVEGPSLVIAGAGSGKTRVLTYRIAHLLHNGVQPSSVLALTFTNKAAREMKERIAEVVGEKIARYLWMGTFHSIFSRILRAESATLGYPSSYTIYDTQDSKSLLSSIIKSLNLEDNTYKTGIVMSRISTAKNNLITPLQYKENSILRDADQAARIPRTAEIYEEYTRRCKNAGAMDFDDLLLMTNVLFARHPEILQKYQHHFKYILVDEYQDTNHSQYLIIKQLAASHQNICVVGDDAQSIYSFRGARIENIHNFEIDYPDYKTYKLEKNYRSTRNIVDAANSVIAKNKKQLQKNVYSENEEGQRIKVINALNDQEEGFLIANEIFERRMAAHDSFADFAILYRTNAQSRVFEEALRKRNIPYRIYGGLSFYQRKEIKDILAYYRLTVNTRDDESLKRIINYPARGIGDTTLRKIEESASYENCCMFEIASNTDRLQAAKLNAGTIKKVTDFTIQIGTFISYADTMKAFDAARLIANEAGILTDLFQDKSPESLSRYENTQELLNAIQLFATEAFEGGRPDKLANFLEEVSLLTDQDQDQKEDANKVTMMTVHSSKGLEFNNVFIVGLEENLFPSNHSGTMTIAELEEERRLFYVALTRTKKYAVLSCAQQRFRWGKTEFCNPSRFIGEIDTQYLDLQNKNLFAHHTYSDYNTTFKERNYASNNINRERSTGSTVPSVNRYQLSPNARVIPTSSSTFEASEPQLIKAGMHVEHERFGRGKVVEVEGMMPEMKAKVFFPNAGEKQLLLKFAKLRIVE